MSLKDYEKTHRYIIQQIVEAREEAHLTQKQVAATGIISQSELSKLENGNRQIDFIIVIQLAALYKKNLSFFIPKI